MSKPIFPHERRSFAGTDELVDLALNLRWSWDHSADDIWRSLAPELWDLTRNPWIILQTVAPDKLQEVTANQAPTTRPAADFTPRLIPYFSGATVPLEMSLILWHNQRQR